MQVTPEDIISFSASIQRKTTSPTFRYDFDTTQTNRPHQHCKKSETNFIQDLIIVD